ncbi:hypothetical protein Q7P37_005526 [Cladosporium fusiforme]
MPTILDPGTVRLSNADVLHWLAQKKEQHASEASADKAAGRKKAFLPDNYQRALRKHERELNAKKYPYTDNPGAYKGEGREKSLGLLVERLDERILAPAEAEFAAKFRDAGDDEAARKRVQADLEKCQEQKGLSEVELLQVYNLAPQCVEILQNIVVDWEERFTGEEMEAVVEVVGEVLRCGEVLPER